VRRFGLAGNHVRGRQMPGLGTLAGAAAKVCDLVNDVGGGQSSEAGILRASQAVRQVTVTTGENVGLSAVGHDVGHGRVVRGMPVGGIEEILRLGGCENRAAVWNMVGLVVDLYRIGSSGVDAERPIRCDLVGGIGERNERNNQQAEDEQERTEMTHADNVMGHRQG